MLRPRWTSVSYGSAIGASTVSLRTCTLAFDPPPARLDAAGADTQLTLTPGARIELSLVVTANRRAGAGAAHAHPSSTPPSAAARPSSAWSRRPRASATNHDLFRSLAAALAPGPAPCCSPRPPEGFVPLRRYPVVRGAVRPRRPHHGAPAPAVRAGARARHAALPRRMQGTVDGTRYTDQEPGKILHEHRRGEMATCREIPFIPYYGSVDATPALRHCSPLNTCAGPTYVDFRARDVAGPSTARSRGCGRWARGARGAASSPTRDARRSACRTRAGRTRTTRSCTADGRLAERPIALSPRCRATSTRRCSAPPRWLEALGREAEGDRRCVRARGRCRSASRRILAARPGVLRARDSIARARPAGLSPPTPGTLLWTRIVSDSRAQIVTRRLMQDDMFTGWGLAHAGERRAPVQPDELSQRLRLAARHGTGGRRHAPLRDDGQFLTLATAIFESVLQFDEMRMPELFCGFPRVAGYAPTRYPVACSPQAWATGVVFQLIGAMLGLRPEAATTRSRSNGRRCPAGSQWIEARRAAGEQVAPGRARLPGPRQRPPSSCWRATATPSSSFRR